MFSTSSNKGNHPVNHARQHESETRADNTSENRQPESGRALDHISQIDNTSRYESLFKHVSKAVSLGNITRLAVTAGSCILFGPMVGIGIGCLALVDAQCNISGQLKDMFSQKEKEGGGQKDKQEQHTTLLGNALRIGLTVAAFLLTGPMSGILVGCIALLDYKLDGALSEKGKKIAVDLSKSIKEAVSKVREYMKGSTQVPGEDVAESQKTQERQETGERESSRTNLQEEVQPQQGASRTHTTRETQRRNNHNTESLQR